MSDSYRPHGLQPTRLLCPWDFPGQSAGVGCHCLLLFKIAFLSLSILMLGDSEFGHWEPLQASVVSTAFLAGIERCSGLIFYLSCLSLGLIRPPFSFSGEWYLEFKIWVLDVLRASQVAQR